MLLGFFWSLQGLEPTEAKHLITNDISRPPGLDPDGKALPYALTRKYEPFPWEYM